MDSLITIVARIRNSDLAAIEARIDALGNPASDPIRAALDTLDEDGSGTHFMSLHAFPAGEGGDDAHLVFEFTADGSEDKALERIVAADRNPSQPDLRVRPGLARQSGTACLPQVAPHRRGFGPARQSGTVLCRHAGHESGPDPRRGGAGPVRRRPHRQ